MFFTKTKPQKTLQRWLKLTQSEESYLQRYYASTKRMVEKASRNMPKPEKKWQRWN
jgi:hypothetical protein